MNAVWLTLILALAVGLCACDEPGKTEQTNAARTDRAGDADERLPTLAELQPQVWPFASMPATESLVMDRQITVQKLTFPADDGRVDLALGALEPVTLGGGANQRWETNGLHIGRLPADRLAMWVANLPEPTSMMGVNIMPGVEYGVVTLIGRIVGQHVARVIDAEGQSQNYRFVGGQYRLLMKLTRRVDSPQNVLVDMVPHHQGLRDSLRLYSDSQEVDGTMFDDLRLTVPAPQAEAWLIWSVVPEPPDDAAAAPQSDETTPPNGDESGTLPVPQRRAAPPKPPVLGPAMMTGQRNGKPVRIVLVVLVN